MRNFIANRKYSTKIGRKVSDIKNFILTKRSGDGHYVAIAVGLLLALAIGGIIWAVVGGNNGAVTTWINSIISKIGDFIAKITG